MSAFDPKRTFGSENCCTQIYVASDGGKNLVIAAHCHKTVKSFGLSDIGGGLEVRMPQFDPELIQVMRSVLDDVMSRVPLEVSGTTAKAYLAEAILKAASQGSTSYNELMTAATDQIQTILSNLT